MTNQYCIYLSSELLLHFISTSSGKCCILYKNVRNIQRIIDCILVADTKGTWKFHLFSVREMDGQTVTKLSCFCFYPVTKGGMWLLYDKGNILASLLATLI